MAEISRYIGFDCGNSSIRTVIGEFDGKRISTEVIHQVPNKAIRAMRYDFWDILGIFEEMQIGFKRAVSRYPDITSFAISTWGIDFGLIGGSGELLGNPLCYRNPLGQKGLDLIPEEKKQYFFRETGIQNHPMNSMFQLIGIREELPEFLTGTEKVLLIPDLLNYLFTGEMNTEVSIASTSQLLDMRDRDFSPYMFETTGLRQEWFPDLIRHQVSRGKLREELVQRFCLLEPVDAICVPSHDTAAAVVAVPTEEEHFAFISSGTWSLIGTESAHPIINEHVHKHGFTNEGGVLDTVTLLKNSAGMHILQNIKRELEFSSDRAYSWDEIIELSAEYSDDASLAVFDPNDSSLYNPDSMIGTLKTLTGLDEVSAVIASAYRSLAMSYMKTIEQLEMITGIPYPVIHIIGGGARNEHLNQLTADLSGKRVIAGPEEATSLGTVALQVMHEYPDLSIADIRKIIRESVELQVYEPKQDRCL